MPGDFMPILGMVGSIVIGSLLQPKPPKAPDPAPAPKAPEAAPLPTPPATPEKEPTISPEDAAANAQAATNRRKRQGSKAIDQPLAIDETMPGSISNKSLLGE